MPIPIPIPDTLEPTEPHATLVAHAARMTPALFVTTHAQHFAFRDIALAAAVAYSSDFDTACAAVRTAWPLAA